MIEMGDPHIFDPGVVAGKLIYIGRLFEEIHLLPRDSPHLIQDHVQIHDILDPAYRRHQFYQPVKESYVPGHGVVDSFSLHLDHHIFSGFEDSSVNLGNGGGTQRLLFNGRENLVPVLPIGPVDDLLHFRKRHGRHI